MVPQINLNDLNRKIMLRNDGGKLIRTLNLPSWNCKTPPSTCKTRRCVI